MQECGATAAARRSRRDGRSSGREPVVRFLVGLHRTAQSTGLIGHASWSIEDVNAEPALVVRIGGRLESIFVLSLDDDVVSGIRIARNPDKLARIGRQLATVS
jgi:RNA polymerase sigma-70 factor (ECF subfamily)